jgi:glycosyltransferase involved in cell wall biosynthesis
MDLFPGVAVEVCELATDELAIPATTDGSGLSMPDAFGNPQPVGDQAVLIVGRLSAAERYKGHDQLIAILPAVAARVPGAQLMIAGAGDDRERLQALAREGGAGRSILFAGFTPPEVLAGLFARCRVFAMPSRGEGFGLVYLEAMGFARPCIASRADGGAEVVADGVTGLVVDPDDLDKLRTAVESLLVDDALAERMGRAGLERLNERFRFHHFQHRLQQRLAPVVPEFLPPDDRQAAMVPEGEVTA